jgi:hypothetical protein
MLAFREGLIELLNRTKLINGKLLLAVLKIHFQFMRIAKNFLGRGYPLHKPHPLDAFGVSPVPPSALLSTVPIVTNLPNDH